MAKFDSEQAASIAAIQQLIHEWAHELDEGNGVVAMGELLTSDVRYNVGGQWREDRAAVLAFYAERHARLAATEEGLPFHRHALHNLRTTFTGADSAEIAFGLVYWTEAGMASKRDHADPALVADVRMHVRREGDGHWRIALFDSALSFRRVPG